jgi:hypothetical protein
MTRRLLTILAGVLLGVTCGFLAATVRDRTLEASTPTAFSTEYQLVLLDNGQAFFGHLEKFGSDHPVMRDVFYIQGQADAETKQVKNSLIKRGKEWHQPDSMILEGRHIVLVEPVSPTSTVAKLIHDYKR